jgi:RNA 3'-terminal phosphate cyclase (ATP)
MGAMLTLDASHGEGGGQIVRTALSLSVALRRSVTLDRIRTRRPKPGLQPQHLAVVQALATVSDASVEGDALNSTRVAFFPRTLRGGDYSFDVGAVRGSAGSVSLLLQALLLPLSLATEPSRLTLKGGTHVPWSPPVHYLTAVFLPALRHMGLQAEVELSRWGWYPRGGGEIEAHIRPTRNWSGLHWEATASSPLVTGISAVSHLPSSIAERQRARALQRLQGRGLKGDIARVEDTQALGAGTFLFLSAVGEHAAGGFSALGRRGIPAEAVADEAVDSLLAYLDSGAAVDDHLADQLVPFLALTQTPSSLTCPTRSSHLETVAWVVEQFLPSQIQLTDSRPARVQIAPARAGGSH